MVYSGRGRRQRRRSPVISPVLRPKLWAALLGAIAAAVLATPAYAEPGVPTTVPDTGSRPAVTGTLQLPGGPPVAGVPAPPVVNVGNGPLATAIAAGETQVGALGEALLVSRQKRVDAQAQVTVAAKALATAQDALLRAQQNADTAAAEAVKEAAALPPGELARDIRGLSRLGQISRGEKVEGGTTGVTGELTRARAGEQEAYQKHATAEAALAAAEAEFTAGETALRTAEASLLKLRRDNAAALIEIERQQEAAEQQIGAGYVTDQNISGMAAHPRAMAAVRYALAQLGDPYKWSEEGPDEFDCSGLMWAAYRSPGADYFDLPRVSRDQYAATRSRTVSQGALLPGDLLFFASGSSWTTIHHVGMYIGNGKMVQAPTTGDVVKISVVRWSRLYAATRVIGAVPAPVVTVPTPPAPKPPTKPTPPPTGKPTPTPSPTKKPTATPTPTGSATPTPTGSATPTPTGSATASPSNSPDSTPTTIPPPPTSAPASKPPTTTPKASTSVTGSGSQTSSPSTAG
ncbi:C40 family peptidase [Micromonospora sp. WMMD1120]|uniref:C40 family peptidase n=1 Tax=Micromonospora sp. WMMD1120 TaxID=3016106 RepID=UPI0024171E5E|nr:C40 family peptidase [Micromonospora sp. WMMD1120]MDG4807281.1 C40 family peptidase [Micromonospora sp. WMMD1120]